MGSVSVVIPCYRYGHFLADCVRSVLDEQPGVDVRVLIIDDASPDDSAEKAHALAAADPRIEVRVHATNKRHIATYNEGLLEWADGDYCVLLSADDRLTPGALVRATALLDANPGVGFVYGHPLTFQDGEELPPARGAEWRSGQWAVRPGMWWLQRRFRAAQGCITSPEVVMRTSVQRRIGGYDPALPHSGDIEMWMRAAAVSDVGHIRGADQAYYRRHGSNMSAVDFGGQLDDLRQRRAAFESVLVKCAEELPERAAWAAHMRRRIARQALRRAVRAYDKGLTGTVPVDELLEFAADCWPEYRRLPEYAGLRVRRAVGVRAMPYLRPLVLSAPLNRGREWMWWQSWRRRGW
ncbi:MAG: glycosyltransferase [Catenulisporales bacterium]|nr:glycosyltransferase [Catenulisporales bacterium]